MVKVKVKEAAFKYLIDKKLNHSKMSDINYSKLELQNYLHCPLFGSEEAQMLFALRTRTVRGVKNDFRGMFQDVMCPVGCGNNDTLKNILTCTVLHKHYKTETLAREHTVLADIYSTDVHKQKQVTQLFTELMKIRENILSNNPVESTGPCINLQRPSILSD